MKGSEQESLIFTDILQDMSDKIITGQVLKDINVRLANNEKDIIQWCNSHTCIIAIDERDLTLLASLKTQNQLPEVKEIYYLGRKENASDEANNYTNQLDSFLEFQPR